MVLPYISYCIHVWGLTANIYKDKIHRLQKKIVRIICGVPPRTHTNPLFTELNIMTFCQLYEYFCGVFMFKLFHEKLPEIFTMFKRVSDLHSIETRQRQKCYVIPSTPTKRAEKISKLLDQKFGITLLSTS